MEILIFSRCINQLNKDLANTSSQIFELEFAQALSMYTKVSIISDKAKKQQSFNNINLFPLINSKSLKKSIQIVIEKNNLLVDKKNIIICFGYDFVVLRNLKRVSKINDAKLISYTFDSHKGAISNKRFLKRFMIDVYYNIGIKYLNSIDAIILFNSEAYKELRLKIPYLISKVGVNKSDILPRVYNRKTDSEFIIIYAGTLIKYNSIDVLIETMKYLNDYDISLNIYGSGPLKDQVLEFADKNKNINYHGLISNKDINKVINEADLLINLRDTSNYVSKFAFPSKIIKYFASGVPVLTTRIIDDNEFCKITFVVDDLNPKNISKKIIDVIKSPIEQKEKSILAKKYIEDNYLWSNVIQDVYKFMCKL